MKEVVASVPGDPRLLEDRTTDKHSDFWLMDCICSMHFCDNFAVSDLFGTHYCVILSCFIKE
jgi:hypothetical protein